MQSRAFTLIELLIVIAIILILIAIALPNFLESQLRAKVVRGMSDMRTFSIAVETYQLDWNAYPPYGRISSADAVEYPATVNDFNDRASFVGTVITSPVAYLMAIPEDLFAGQFTGPAQIHLIEYLNLDQHIGNFSDPAPPFVPTLLPAWGHWRMVAAGPDGDRGQDIKNNKVYAPTNGTQSDGDIVRSNRSHKNEPGHNLAPPA
jgi:prepilin-type N-terminal cleavage/methylation domain-containing protein